MYQQSGNVQEILDSSDEEGDTPLGHAEASGEIAMFQEGEGESRAKDNSGVLHPNTKLCMLQRRQEFFGHDEGVVTSSLDSDGGDQVEIGAESGKRRVDDRKSRQEPVSSSVTGNPRVAVGTKVRKYFEDHGWFLGTVVSYDRDYYRVVYEDSDSEEYSELELSKIVFRSGDCEMDGVDDREQTQTQGAAAVTTVEKRDLHPNHNVGTAVRKYFKGHGWFAGRIASIRRCIYVIVCSDSDEEEYRFDDSELGSIVRASEEHTDNMQKRKTHNPADYDETIQHLSDEERQCNV